MTRFFDICDNSLHLRGFPWGVKITGTMNVHCCSTCRVNGEEPVGDIDVHLDHNKGKKWPDVLGDGSQILLTVSLRVLADWQREGIGPFPVHRAIIKDPYPQKTGGYPSAGLFLAGWKTNVGGQSGF
jgi:hypothetical protein